MLITKLNIFKKIFFLTKKKFFLYNPQIIFKLLKLIYKTTINNWGYSIIISTIIIKLIILPITTYQIIHTKKIQKLQYKILSIQKKYKNNIHKKNRKIIKLYKKNQTNIFIYILPTIIQIYIFFELYNIIKNYPELKNAYFAFWIKDISIPDVYRILPIISTISNIKSQNFPNYFKKQQKINTKIIILLIISLIFSKIPSGIMLYYITNNIFTIIQKYVIKNYVYKIF